jgi:hypothetical protein
MNDVVGSAGDAADLETKRFPGQTFERRGLPARGPELQLRVAGGAQLQQVVVAAVVQLESRDRLRVAAVEAFREAQDRRERADRVARPAAHVAEAVVAAFGRRLTVIARDERDGFDFIRLEAAEVAVANQVVRMFVVLLVADVDADVVEDRGVLEPLALPIREAVNRPRLIEECDGEARDVLRMIRKVIAALGELEHAAPPHVRIPIGLRDLLAVARDVVEDETFAQRQVAERDFRGAEAAEQFVEQHDAGDREVRASGFQAGHAHPLFEIQCEQLLARPANLLGGDAPVAQRRSHRPPLGGQRDSSKAQDRAGCPDDAIESGPRDLIRVFSDLLIDVAHELALVAALERIAFDEAFGQPDHAEFEAAAQLQHRSRSPGHFHAAAADVDHDRRVAGRPDAVDGGEMDEPRLFSSRNDARPDPGFTRNRLQELSAVFGLARGAGRHSHDLFHAVRLGEPPEL